jgi:hypothetical protein
MVAEGELHGAGIGQRVWSKKQEVRDQKTHMKSEVKKNLSITVKSSF